MPGPPKTPTRVLEMRGSWRAKTRPNEPQPPAAMPAKPKWLTARRGGAVWNELAPRLHAMGLLTEIDGAMFGRYCSLTSMWSRAERAMAQAEKRGDEERVERSRGAVVRLAGEMLKIERQFGLSPSARASVSAQPPKAERTTSRYFKGRA